MSARRIVQVLLLAIVAVTIALALRPRPEASPTDAEVPAAGGVTAYYFHAEHRCPTCLSIERQAEAALADAFAAELERGALTWKPVNLDAPASATLVDRFELTHGTLVLADEDSERFVKLDRVWELVDDEEAFRRYVESEVRTWLERRT